MRDINFIPELTEKLLTDNNLFSVPVDVDALAKKLDITVKYEDLEESLSGFLVVKNGVSTVVINKDHHPNRQRFTLAHEIGHFSLHVEGKGESVFMEKKQIYNRNIISSTGTDQQEIEANSFAANLLMPKSLMHYFIQQEKDNEFINDFSGDSNSVAVLADRFEVSQAAFGHRLSSLFLS